MAQRQQHERSLFEILLPDGHSMVMVVCFLMVGDLLVALNLGILPAGRIYRRAPRVL